MPLDTTYSVGTVSVSAGGRIVTGNGTLFTAGALGSGDVLEINGLTASIERIISPTELELARPWPASAVAGASYEIRRTPDSSRVMGRTLSAWDEFTRARRIALDAEEVARLADKKASPFASRAAVMAQGIEPGITNFIIRGGFAFREAPSSASVFALMTPDGRKWWPDGFTSPEHFGAVGNGSTSDRLAIQAMYDCIPVSGTSEVRFDARKEYALDGPISTTARHTRPGPKRIVAVGVRPNHLATLIDINANVTVGRTEIRFALGAYYQRAIRLGRGEIGDVIVTAPARIAGYEDAAGAAVTLSGDSDTQVKSIKVVNFDQSVTVRFCNNVTIGTLETLGSVRGIRCSDGEHIFIGSHTHRGRKVPFSEASGSYGQDFKNWKHATCPAANIRDTTSHGIRASGETDDATQHLTWGTVEVWGAGRCGVKFQGATDDAAGSSPTWISHVSFEQLKIYDAGRLCDEYLVANNGVGEFSDNGTGPEGGANEYALSLVKTRHITINNFVSEKVSNRYASGSAGINVRSSQYVRIPSAKIDSAYYYGIKFGAAEADCISIHIKGTISRVGTFADNRTSEPGTVRHSRGYGWWAWGGSGNEPGVVIMNDWQLELDIIDCRRGFYHRCTNFPRANILRGTMARNFEGANDNSPPSNQYLNMMQFVSARS